MFEKILVPVDGSPEGEQVIAYATAIADKFSSKVYVLFAIKPIEVLVGYDQEIESEFQTRYNVDYLYKAGGELVQAVQDKFRELGIKDVEGDVRDGHPADVILDYAREKEVSLIVMGTHGRRGVRTLLGSVASEVIHKAPVPVMMVKISKSQKTD